MQSETDFKKKENGVVINTNNLAYNNALSVYNNKVRHTQEMILMKERISSLESKIDTIITLLQNKDNTNDSNNTYR